MTWKVYERNPNGWRFANIEDGNGHLIFQSLHSGTAEWQARALSDAMMAAAAPDLAAALEAIVHKLPRPEFAPEIAAAHEALIKAKGEI